MGDIKDLTEKIIKFRDERDWKQFHNPKDVAISLALEASEVLEHFQWKSKDEFKEYDKTNKDEIGEELADVFNFLLIMAHDLEIDLVKAEEKKLRKNEKKYSVEKAKGNAKKYTELRKL